MTIAPLKSVRTSLGADAVRFLVAGILNTLLTLGIYQVLLFALPSSVSYMIAWGAGIAFAMIIYPSRVFPQGRKSLADRLSLGAIYVAVFLFGLTLLEGLALAGVAPRLGILAVMFATTAANFLAARLLLRR